MNLTIFDLDNTLLNGDSDHAWGVFLSNQGLVDKEDYQRKNDQFYEQYKAQTLDIYEYQSFVLSPLIGMDEATRKTLSEKFIIEMIEPMRLPKAEALIEEHRQAGDQLLIITATNRFITEPIAKLLGIEELLATEPEIKEGMITGQVIGTPCFQKGKITRLHEWLNGIQQTFEKTTFYSDSINDKPLLEYADVAVAVDPDDALRQEAEKCDWRIISLR